MLIKEIFVIIYVIVFTKAQNAITNEEAEINNLFSDSGNNLAQIDTTPKICDDGHGECVPFYQCKNGTQNNDGELLLDIRFSDDNECLDYFETCCAFEDQLPKNSTETLNKYIEPLSCGRRNPNGVGFILGGNSNNESQYAEFPWMLAILKNEMADNETLSIYKCGASLITPNVALTGAHCIQGLKLNEIKVRAGEWDTQTTNELFRHIDFSVTDVVIHEKFNSRNLHNDVALLFLKETAELVEHINTICLPPQNFNFEGKRCFVTGWGKDIFGKTGIYQVILKKIELPVVPFAKCQANLRKTRLGRRFLLNKSFMCAGGEEGIDACQGDGGGPLVCEIDGAPGHYYQAGIVAWGIGCGTKDVPGVYGNVAEFRTWIDQKITSRNLPIESYKIKI